MDVSTSQQFIDVYNRISKLETDITNVVKEFYSNLVKSYDEIVDTPENLSDFNNDLDFITKDEVENRINSISIDDSNYLKKAGEEKQKCTAPTEFEELYTTTQDPEDSSDKVATTKFVHSLVSNNGDTVTQQIIGAVGKKYITSKAAESMIKERIGEHAYGNVVNLVNKKIEIAVRGIENIISDIDIPSSTSDLVNDSGYITLNDVPGDLVTSVNGLTGDVLITIPQVPTNISSFTNDVGYITDPGVTSVNNRTGNVMVQENVQSDWSATTGLAKILNKPALKSVAVTGDYNDLENTPDLSIYAQAEDLADVAVSGSYTDLTNTPEIPPTMTILSYGNSNWLDFMNAYTTNTVVYCRASSNSNPASGSLTRMAFLAYVNNATNPTEVEFQYYRSVSTHTDSLQGDQVYVYKLNSSNGGKWSVTVREAYTKIIAGTNLTSSYASSTTSGKITLNAPSNISAFTNDVGYLTEHQDLSDYATITDVQTEVASLVDQAPTTLDTLNELATALGNDPNFATTVASLIGAKYTKPANGIPSTDLTSDVQTSLGKANTALQSFTEIDPTVPSHVKEITTTDISNWNSKQAAGNYVTTDTQQTITAQKTFNSRVNFLGSGDNNAIYLSTNTRIDVNGTSYTVLGFINGTFIINHTNYNLKLRGKGTRPVYNTDDNPLALLSDIPTNVSQLTNDVGYLTSYTETDPTVPAWAKASTKPTYSYSEITNTPTLATVATSGSYNDLSNKPTIPEADVALTTSELDEAWSTVFGVTISFTVNSITYQAESGMTWTQWVASNYNTDEFYLGKTGRGVYIDRNYYITDGRDAVGQTDIIIDDYVYSLGSGKI